MSRPAHRLIRLLLCCCFLPLPVHAQKKKPDESVAHLYQIADDQRQTDMSREHIPLDGAAVRYIPFRKDKLYGFVDKATKKWVIQPRFSQVFAVYPEGAIVQDWNAAGGYAGSYGLVDYKGKWVIRPVFPNLYKEGNLYHGVFQSSDKTMNESYSSFIVNYYFDTAGRFIYTCNAHWYQTFAEGDSLAWARFGTKFTVFNRAGKELKHFEYDAASYFLGIFNNTLVFGVQSGGEGPVLYTGYDVGGEKLWAMTVNGRYNAVYRLSPAAFAFFSEDAMMLCDEQGREAPYGIQQEWNGNSTRNLFPLLNGMGLISVADFNTGLTGYINAAGVLVIPCKYKYAGTFYEGLAPYLDTASRTIGFIDSLDQKVVPAVIPADKRHLMLMSKQPHFSEGLCRVERVIRDTNAQGRTVIRDDRGGRPATRFSYIDKSGVQKLLLPDSIITAGSFSDGLAPVVGASGRLGFIDTGGKLVIPMKYELAVAGAYPFPQVVWPYFRNGFAYLKAFKGYLGKDGYRYFSGKQVKDQYNFSH